MRLIPVLILLAGCSTTTISYPSVCTNNEPKCQRNLDAQTLAILGEKEAAVQLMCMDSGLADVIGEQCVSQ